MSQVISRYVIIVCLVALVLLLLVYAVLKHREDKVDDNVFTKKNKHVHSSHSKRVYENLQSVPLIRAYTRKIHGVFEMYFPGDERTIIEMTDKVVLMILAVVAAVMAIILALRSTLFTVFCGVVLVYVVSDSIVQYTVDKINRQLYRELDNFIELLQFNYLQSHMIEEALSDSIVGKNKLVEKHMKKILDVLRADDFDDAMNIYNTAVSDRFLKELACICFSVFQYGDPIVDNQHSFLKNLKMLKGRIGAEVTRKNEVDFRFRFRGLICIAPLFFVSSLKNWAIKEIPELESFFNGYYGFTAIIVCTVVCIVSYFLNNVLKSDGLLDLSEHNFLTWVSELPPIKKQLTSYYNANYGRKLQYVKLLKQVGSKLTVYTLAVKRFLFAIVTMVVTIVLFIGMNIYTKDTIQNSITGKGSRSSAANEEESIVMMLMIKGYTNYYLEHDILRDYNSANGTKVQTINDDVKNFWQDQLFDEFDTGRVIEISDDDAMQVIKQYNKEHSTSTKLYTAYFGTEDGQLRTPDADMMELAEKQLSGLVETACGKKPLSLELFEESVATDVMDRVMSYKNAYVHWYHVFISCIAGSIAFFIPYVWILINKRSLQQLLEAEVMQFQAIVLVLMPIKSMSPQTIMDWLFMFSRAFRSGIHRCLIMLPASEEKAFDDLIEEEKYEPFQDLIRKMKMCDRVGVQNAFSTLEVTRNNFAERNKQAAAQRLEKNADLSGALILVPAAVVFGAILAVPFLLEAFGELSTTMSRMSTM